VVFLAQAVQRLSGLIFRLVSLAAGLQLLGLQAAKARLDRACAWFESFCVVSDTLGLI
jgi:hypothetical protein